MYRDLRQRGYVVKTAGEDFDFRVFPRGGSPTTTQTKNWVAAISERALFNMSSFVEDIDRAERTRKELLLAVVDEEGDLTYYHATGPNRRGGWRTGAAAKRWRPACWRTASWSSTRPGPSGCTEAATTESSWKVLQLSLIEAAYLMEEGRLRVTTLATSRNVPLPGSRRGR